MLRLSAVVYLTRAMQGNDSFYRDRARRCGAAIIFSVCALLAPSAAQAGENLDEIALQNGGVVKGEILVLEPGEKVVIQVPGEDEPRTIPWSEVSDVQRGEETAARETKSAPAEAPKREGRGVVKVHIDSEDPNVYLVQHRVAGTVRTPYGAIVGYESNTVCHAPCDKEVNATRDHRFTIEGDDIRPSREFSLHQYEGDVTADVDPSSPALRGLGIASIAVGGATMLAGAFVTALSFTSYPTIQDPVGKPLGIGLLVGGAPLVVGGIVMMVLSRTTVDIEPKSKATRLARKPRYWRGEF